ncbi:hypothetical protein [Tenacibaculum sp. 47A_GOM-205m]|uniref:hypothetical protein n=1 Tax=Tenacibaculum sp. 47A_GOM-205m TaxID=1380384 RepID=UPI0004BBAC22|nr:hypothetical protein [Tenacibaculum sp. 47A_GOM-205m]
MSSLNASKFDKKSLYQQRDFEYVISVIYTCYNKMLQNYSVIENNENKIRNRLYKDFLKPVKVKEGLSIDKWIFHPEVPEIDDSYHEYGRTDIMLYLSDEYLKSENAYYVIECKRIDGGKTLNDAYIQNGMNRFIGEKYPVYNNKAGMLGFVVKSININDNSVENLKLKKNNVISNANFEYISQHTTSSGKDFCIYHLMLDFSSKIK